MKKLSKLFVAVLCLSVTFATPSQAATSSSDFGYPHNIQVPNHNEF